MHTVYSDSKNKTTGLETYKTLALYSTTLYIILSTVFEESRIGLSRYASIGILICLGCCSVYTLASRKIRISKTVLSLLFFGIILTVSMVYSPSSGSLKTMYIHRYWTSWLLMVLVSNVIRSEKDIKILISGYVIAGTLLALYVYIFYGIQNLSSLSNRLSNELANQNSIGISCACSFIFSVIELTTHDNKRRYVYLFPMVITIPACLYSGSRKSIILILICVLVFLMLYSEHKHAIGRVLFTAAIIGGIIYIIKNVAAFNIIHSRFEQLFNILDRGNDLLDAGDINRLRYIEMGLEAFKDSPLWGNGFIYSYYLFGTYSHNNYIELLMNNGIIGFFSYYIIHIGLFVSVFRVRLYSKRASAILAVLVSLLLFTDVGSVNYYSRYFLILLCVASKLASYRKTMYTVNTVSEI